MNAVEDIRPYIEFTAVAAGAASGALHARRREFDFVGVVVVGIATGLGGGLIRDALLGHGAALALQKPALLVTAIVAALIGALFASVTHHLARPIWIADALSIGLFAVAGVQRAEHEGLAIVPCLFLGVVTCVGGGVTRDVLCRETPKLLLPGQPYAVSALLASSVYLIAVRGLGVAPVFSEWLAVGVASALRVLAAWRNWTVPVPPDLPGTLQQRIARGERDDDLGDDR